MSNNSHVTHLSQTADPMLSY